MMTMPALFWPSFRRTFVPTVVFALAGLASAFASAGEARFERIGGICLATATEGAAIDLALVDLAADMERVLGVRGERVASSEADVVVQVDSLLGGAERWRITISAERVTIVGSDLLGAVHGIYTFSERALGVDPLWFWKGMPPERKERLALAAQTWESPTAKFRYRGWFINDEDLLTEFGTSGGPRTLDYPFYHQVIDYAMADRIFEGLLRLGGNLIIPASFVEILNPAEAELVRRNGVPAAIRHLERSLVVREPLAAGVREGWYAGDTKANWPGILDRLRKADTSKR